MNFLLTAMVGLVAISAYAANGVQNFVPGEVIIKFKDGVRPDLNSLHSLYDSVRVARVTRFSGIAKGMEQLILEDGVNVQDAVITLRANPDIQFAQPNYVLGLLPDPKTGKTPVFNLAQFDSRPALNPAPAEVSPPVADPSASALYGMQKIGADKVWGQLRGNKSVIVADIDTGIDYNHEDLAFNVWRNPNPTQGDVVGFDFIHNDGIPFDDQGHGTHTAGTIGAVGGNGIGVSGVAQRVSIMSVKFLSAEGQGDTAGAIKSIDYAVAHGAKILSNSWGGTKEEGDEALAVAIERAMQKDVLFVVAAGNSGMDNDKPDQASFPAGFKIDNMISVAATDANDKLVFFSNFGKTTTHLGAPGVNILSTMPGNKYVKENGTSMACPHVAGAAALVWAKHPDWNYKQVKEALVATVDPSTYLSGKTITGGRLNIYKALQR